MQDQLVSFKTSKLAKLKGFNEPTLTGFHGSKIHDVLYSDVLEGLTRYNTLNFTYEGINTWTSAPTQSLLQRWLREVHKINIQISIMVNPMYNGYNSEIRLDRKYVDSHYCSKTYEDSLELALQKALKLIK